MAAQFLKWNRIVVTVAAAGTPVQVSTLPLWVRSCTLQAHFQNTGAVFLGDTSPHALSASAHALAAGGSLNLTGDMEHARAVQLDLSNLWVDAATNGSKLIVSYLSEILT